MYFCPCRKGYLCSNHLGVHLELPGTHHFEKLTILPAEESGILRKEIINLIVEMKKKKSNIVSDMKKFIEFAEESAKLAAKKIQKIVNYFLQLLNQKSLYHVQKMKIEEKKEACFQLRYSIYPDLNKELENFFIEEVKPPSSHFGLHPTSHFGLPPPSHFGLPLPPFFLPTPSEIDIPPSCPFCLPLPKFGLYPPGLYPPPPFIDLRPTLPIGLPISPSFIGLDTTPPPIGLPPPQIGLPKFYASNAIIKISCSHPPPTHLLYRPPVSGNNGLPLTKK